MNFLATLVILGLSMFLVHGVCKTTELTLAESAVVDRHNMLRQKHRGTPDLCYGISGGGATFNSQTWSETQATNGGLKHSAAGDYGVGENLAQAGTSGIIASRKDAFVNSANRWYNEVSNWNFTTSSKINATTGHFTQVVWKDTTQINCGYATYETQDPDGKNINNYIVTCQYYPAGNWEGEYADKVKALKPVVG